MKQIGQVDFKNSQFWHQIDVKKSMTPVLIIEDICMMNIDFSKSPDGLIPAVIQDLTHKVLMLGFMNQDA